MNRSKRYWFYISLFLLTFSSFAQVQIGLVSGWSGSKFSGFFPGWVDFENKTGIPAGVRLEVPLYRKLSGQFQLLYTQNDTNMGFFDDLAIVPAKITLHQLELPLG